MRRALGGGDQYLEPDYQSAAQVKAAAVAEAAQWRRLVQLTKG
ncbi:MAG: hypothetical protein ACRECD_10015 [Burkholderiaceae bacterium]